jgi:hypothetical protein
MSKILRQPRQDNGESEGKAHTLNTDRFLGGHTARASSNSYHRGQEMTKHLAPPQGQETRDHIGWAEHRSRGGRGH